MIDYSIEAIESNYDNTRRCPSVTRNITLMNTVRCRKQTCISKIEGVGTIKDTNIDMERDAQTPLRISCRIRLSRNDLITCLNYGRDRKSVFPEYYFCGKCDNWEIFVDTNTVGAKKRHSQRNKCQSSHQNPSHPNTLKKNVIQGYLMQLDHSKSDIDNEEDSDHTTIGESTDESSDATDRESCKYDRTNSSGNHNNHALSIEQINADGTAVGTRKGTADARGNIDVFFRNKKDFYVMSIE